MPEKANFKCTAIYGHCEVKSWFICKEGKLLGMGSVTYYDDTSKITGYKKSPTGTILTLGGA